MALKHPHHILKTLIHLLKLLRATQKAVVGHNWTVGIKFDSWFTWKSPNVGFLLTVFVQAVFSMLTCTDLGSGFLFVFFHFSNRNFRSPQPWRLMSVYSLFSFQFVGLKFCSDFGQVLTQMNENPGMQMRWKTWASIVRSRKGLQLTGGAWIGREKREGVWWILVFALLPVTL